MRERILYYFFHGNYVQCLALCESNMQQDMEFCIEFAALSTMKLGQYPKCIQYFTQISTYNRSTFWLLNFAKVYVLNSNFSEAFVLLDECLRRQDDLWYEVALELAFAYKATKNLEQADLLFNQLIERNSLNLELWMDYAELYFKDDPQKSLEIHEKAREVAKNLIEVLRQNKQVPTISHLSGLQDRLLKEDENPQIDEVNNYLNTKVLPQIAFLYLKLYRNEESVKLFNSLAEFNQENARFWQNFAKALEFTYDYQGAYDAYQKSMKIQPHATYSFDCAYLLMRIGRFDEGVKMYESRLFYANLRTFSPRHYTQSINAFNKYGVDAFKDKVICIFCEQGYGDTIMYARCLEKLCGIAKKVLFAPQSMLYTVFENSVKKINQQKNTFKNMVILDDIPRDFDYAMPICSLPLMCNISLDEISNKLQTPICRVNAPKKQDNGKKKDSKKDVKKIGLFWFTPSARDSDLKRNCKLELLLEALKDAPYELVSFQVEGDDPKNLPQFIENRGEKLKSFEDTINLLEDIDCMVAIDSAIAHLSLALDIPTVVLLYDRFDWRWGPYEKPASYFWPKASFTFINKDMKGELRTKIEEAINQKS